MVTLLRFFNITPAATAQKNKFSTANPHLLKKTYSFITNFTALLQRNPGPAVSHWILQIFIEQLLHGITMYRCFFLYKFLVTLFKHLIYFTSVVPFCTPSKYQENQNVVFRGCRNGILIWNGLGKRDFICSTDSCLWTRNLEGFFAKMSWLTVKMPFSQKSSTIDFW